MQTRKSPENRERIIPFVTYGENHRHFSLFSLKERYYPLSVLW
jgi:hypothetical protein